MPVQSDVVDLPSEAWTNAVELEIVRQRETIAKLELMDHEVTDAKKHLGELLVTLAAIQRARVADAH